MRTDLLWDRVERSRGAYVFTDYDRQYAALSKNGLIPYAILDYSNNLYDGGESPQLGHSSYRAFLSFVQAVAHRYKDVVKAWEIWNEPNQFWKPYPEARRYATLCHDVARVVRKIAPSALIIGGATAGIPQAFLQECAELGAFEDIDLVSVHPYRHDAPENALPEMQQLEVRLREASRRKLTVIAGEWGYSTAWKQMTPQLQASYLTRMMLSNFGTKRPLTVWYDLVQDGDHASEPEHNFGILSHQTLAPLPAYKALSTLLQLFGGARLIDTHINPDGTWLLDLRDAVVSGCAVWSTQGPSELTLELRGATAGFDMFGNLLWTDLSASRRVALDPLQGPLYIVGGCQAAK